MPTPPRETIGGKLLPNQEMSFNHMNRMYEILTELEEFINSPEYINLDVFEQEFYNREFINLNNEYEDLLNVVNRY